MSIFKKNVKAIIESSKSEEELLNNLDSLNRPLTMEELAFVSGGLGNVCNCDECGSAAEGEGHGGTTNPISACPYNHSSMVESCISCSYCQFVRVDPENLDQYYYCPVLKASYRCHNR